MKRASIEPNFHNLYAQFLVTLKSEKLYEEVVKETYKNIKILLTSDKSKGNFSDRSLLKNLGHWLGLMLLARNKPILMVDLDMKQLIIEAYLASQKEKQQELLYVVPFVGRRTAGTDSHLNCSPTLTRRPDTGLSAQLGLQNNNSCKEKENNSIVVNSRDLHS